jgi:hypothetical protein
MSATEAAAIIVAIASIVAVVLLGVCLVFLVRTLRSLQRAVDTLHKETLPVVTELRGTVSQANAELERVDVLLGTAESISTTVDSASRLAYLAFSNPVIKVLALASGTSRAAKRFRKTRDA